MNELLNIDIPPITKIIWNSDYLPLKDKLFDLAREVYLAELKTVAEGFRECSTTHIRSEWFFEDLKYLTDMGLVFVPLRKCARVHGFAHKFYDIIPNQPYDIFGVVARNMEVANKWATAYQNNNHRLMGKLLGYPDCCVNFFNKVFPVEYDPIFSAAKNTRNVEIKGNMVILKELYAECNMMLRYFGVRGVPHLVCSFTCRESKKLAETFLDFVDNKKVLIRFLENNVVWDSYKGIAIIKTPYFIGAVNTVPYTKKHVIRW